METKHRMTHQSLQNLCTSKRLPLIASLLQEVVSYAVSPHLQLIAEQTAEMQQMRREMVVLKHQMSPATFGPHFFSAIVESTVTDDSSEAF